VAVLCKSQMLLADFAAFIIMRILPGYIHPPGSVCLRHLGDIRESADDVAAQGTGYRFLDESSINIDRTRLYGRAAPDERVVDSVPQASGPQTTTLAVIGWTGISAPLVLSCTSSEHLGQRGQFAKVWFPG